MFKRGNLQSGFRIFPTGCRLFATRKIPVILLVTDFTTVLKITFF